MRIVDLFDPAWMTMDLQAADKWDAITQLAGLLQQHGCISSLQAYLQAVREREEQVSTGVGMGIAIPHGKSDAVLTPAIAFGRSQAGLDFGSIDDEPAFLVFLLAVPSSFGNREYMQTLARLARLLVHESFQVKLMDAQSSDQVLRVIQEAEKQYEEAQAARQGAPANASP
jgi:PTS system fructose-specific IIC component